MMRVKGTHRAELQAGIALVATCVGQLEGRLPSGGLLLYVARSSALPATAD